MPHEIIAETERLILRRFCKSDIDRLAEILADPKVMKFSIKGTYSLEQTRKYVEYTISSYKSDGLGLWAAVHKADDNLIGYSGHLVHELDGQHEIELTYRFAKEYWGKGLATEAGKATCEYAFNQLRLNRLISIIDVENIASIRVAEKCGLKHEKNSSFHGVPVRIYAIDGIVKICPVKNNEDFDTVRKLFLEYADCLGFDLGFQNFEKELANLPGDYATPEGCLLIAKYKGQIAGCVALRKFSDGVCEMRRLYVKQEFRGLKIGRALTESIIEISRKAGYNSMRLDFIAPRVSESLYRSLGFKQIAPYEDIPIEGTVFMELKLQ